MNQTAALRRCVGAVGALWFLNGAVTLSIGPRLPEIAESLGLGYGDLGTALVGQAAGLLVAMLPAAWLADRVGATKMAVGAAMAFAASSALVGLAQTPWQLFLLLGLVGVANAPLDVANPTLGKDLGLRRGKTTMSLLEAGFTLGAAVGGLAGSFAATRVSVAWHLAAVGTIGTGIAALAGVVLAANYRHLPEAQPEPDDAGIADRGRRRTRPAVVLAWLAIVASASLGSEAAGQDWLGFLFRDLGAPPTRYALGYAAFVGALFIAQMLGGRIADRAGATTVVRVGGALFAVGMVVAVASGSLPLAVAGLAIAGLGLGNAHPLALDSATRIKPRARSVAVVNGLSLVGLAASRPAVGQLAELTSLRSALAIVGVVLGLVICVGAWVIATPIRRAYIPRHAYRPRRLLEDGDGEAGSGERSDPDEPPGTLGMPRDSDWFWSHWDNVACAIPRG